MSRVVDRREIFSTDDEAGSITMENGFSITGKRIVVTGGTAGIGRAVAAHFAAEDARVVITGRRASGAEIAAVCGAEFVAMDVTDDISVRSAMATAAEHLGGIDVLVLNAGIDLATGTLDDLDLDAFRRVLDVNLGGVVRGMAFGIPHMGPGGSVIATSSPAGKVTAAGTGAYSASKAAVDSIVRTAAIELGPKGIRVNGIRPGIVESEMTDGSTGDPAMLVTLTVNGAHRRADEIVGVFHFLASDASAPLTGGIVDADDGIGAGLSGQLLERAFGAPAPNDARR